MIRGNGRSFTLVFLVFLIFLSIFLPSKCHYQYFHDDLLNLRKVKEIFSNPWAGWGLAPEGFRRYPMPLYFLFLEYLIAGLSPLSFFLSKLLIHFFNSILMICLVKKLGAKNDAAMLAGLLFLSSSSFYQVFLNMTSVGLHLCLFFLLLASLDWIEFLKGRAGLFWRIALFQVAALLSYEAAMIFPILCLAMMGCGRFAAAEFRTKKNRDILLRYLLPLLLIDFAVIIFLTRNFLASPAFAEKISVSALFLLKAKLLGLTRMFIAPLFTWDKGFFSVSFTDSPVIRMMPLLFFAVLFSGTLFLTRKWRQFLSSISKETACFSLCWMAIALIPFMLHPLSFEHVTRYLYIPFVGFSILFGLAMSAFFEVTERAYSRKVSRGG